MAHFKARMITCYGCRRLLFVDALNPLGKCACGYQNVRP